MFVSINQPSANSTNSKYDSANYDRFTITFYEHFCRFQSNVDIDTALFYERTCASCPVFSFYVVF